MPAGRFGADPRVAAAGARLGQLDVVEAARLAATVQNLDDLLD